MTKKPNRDLILFQGIWSLVLLLSHWMDFNHWKGYTAQRQGNTMIRVFWDLNFLCDYLSPNGLFYYSVTYLLLLNKILLMLTKRVSQWNLKNNELILRPRTVQLCFLSVLSTVSALPLQCYFNQWGIHTDALKWISFGESFDLMYFIGSLNSLHQPQAKLNQALLFFVFTFLQSNISLCFSAVTCTLCVTKTVVHGNWNSSKEVPWLNLNCLLKCLINLSLFKKKWSHL